MSEKLPFEFENSEPCLDWYKTTKLVINPDDFIYFKLQRRYHPFWWLIGMKTVHEPKYHWEEKSIGYLPDSDLKRFVEWAKYPNGRGSRIIEIKMLSGDQDIFEHIKSLTAKLQ